MEGIIEDYSEDYNATIEAIKKSDLQKVKKHIANVPILSKKSFMYRTFLNYAIEAENIDVFNYLANLEHIGINVSSAVWDYDEQGNYRTVAHATPLEQLMFFQAQKKEHKNPNFEDFKIKAMTTLKQKNAKADFKFFLDDEYDQIKKEYNSLKIYSETVSNKKNKTETQSHPRAIKIDDMFKKENANKKSYPRAIKVSDIFKKDVKDGKNM